MELEINIGRALSEHTLEAHGRVQELAKVIGVHRHSMRRLMDGAATHVKIECLGALCQWFHEQTGLDREELLRGFFQFRPNRMWDALAKMGHVSIVLGEYRQAEPNSPARLWVNRRDTAVANAVAAELGQYSLSNETHIQIDHVHVPFRFAMHLPDIQAGYFQEDARNARRLFRALRSGKSGGAAVLVGSQEVNYMTECFVSALFKAKPFSRPVSKPTVPFHVKSRHVDSQMQSCFGGAIDPPGYPAGEADLAPGVYWLDKRNKWVGCPRIEGKQDAGLVIVHWDTSSDTMDVALFGVSGRATAAMVDWVVRKTEDFWPPYCVTGGKRVGVYICRFILDPRAPKERYGNLTVQRCEVEQVDGDVLNRFL